MVRGLGRGPESRVRRSYSADGTGSAWDHLGNLAIRESSEDHRADLLMLGLRQSGGHISGFEAASPASAKFRGWGETPRGPTGVMDRMAMSHVTELVTEPATVAVSQLTLFVDLFNYIDSSDRLGVVRVLQDLRLVSTDTAANAPSIMPNSLPIPYYCYWRAFRPAIVIR